MKITYQFLIAFLLFLSCLACEDEPMPPTPTPPAPCQNDCDTSKLEIVWQVPLTDDTLAVGANTPIIYKDKVLFNKLFDGPQDLMVLRDGWTGKKLWSWEDDQLFHGSEIDARARVVGNKLLASAGNDYYCIDLENGATIWETNINNGEGHQGTTSFEDYVFHVHTNQGTVKEKSHLVASHFSTGVWDTIFTANIRDDFEPRLYPPAGWRHPSGDIILFFQNRSRNFSSEPKGKVDLYAYNMTADSILWLREDLLNGQSRVEPLLVEDRKVYIMGLKGIECFDAQTGKTIWYREGISDVTGGMVKVGDKLITNPDGLIGDGRVYVLDANTGSTLNMTQFVTGGNNSPPVYHNGILYFTSGDGKLYAIDIARMKVLWAEKSPNRKLKRRSNASFRGGYYGLSINPELGYLYTDDGYFAMCIKLAKRGG